VATQPQTSQADHHLEIDRLLRDADQMADNRQSEQMLVLATKAYEQSTAIDYVQGQAHSLCVMGQYNLETHQLETAITQAEKARCLSLNNDDPVIESQAIWVLIRAHFRLADYATVLELVQRRLVLCELLNAKPDHARTVNFLGLMYLTRAMYDEAVPYFKQSLGISQQIEDLVGIARTTINLTVVSIERGDLDNAELYGQLALSVCQQLDEADGIARSYKNLARVSLELGDYEASRERVENAWSYAQKARMMDQILVLRQWADLDIAREDGKAAVERLEQALALAEQTDAIHKQMHIHRSLVDAHRIAGDFETALTHFEHYDTLRERIYNAESEQRISSLEVLHRTEAARRESAYYQSRTQELQIMWEQDRQHFTQLTKMKDDLLSTASHDLKNPLTIILTSVQLIKRIGSVRDERGARHVDIIEAQVERMRSLITNLLDLARLETQDAIHREPVKVYDVMQQCFAHHQPEAQVKHITFSVDVSPVTLMADLDVAQVHQALDNLLSNAIKYTPEGGRVMVTASKEKKSVLCIKVRDSGIGIPKDDLPRIFERFYRVRDDLRRTYEGTGLGLAIVKSIVERHNGKITVGSMPGEGTTFTIKLPLKS